MLPHSLQPLSSSLPSAVCSLLHRRQLRLPTPGAMACLTAAAAVSIPKLTRFRACSAAPAVKLAAAGPARPAVMAVRASLREVGAAVVATAASLAGSALAITVLLGSDDGSLVYEPDVFSIASGDEITYFNNKSFPHNIVFDPDDVPEGVDADKISMPDLLESYGETYKVILTVKGSYGFYCEPHVGAGMKGKVTVT